MKTAVTKKCDFLQIVTAVVAALVVSACVADDRGDSEFFFNTGVGSVSITFNPYEGRSNIEVTGFVGSDIVDEYSQFESRLGLGLTSSEVSHVFSYAVIFDPEEGRFFRQDLGSGVVNSNGFFRLVDLPQGALISAKLVMANDPLGELARPHVVFVADGPEQQGQAELIRPVITRSAGVADTLLRTLEELVEAEPDSLVVDYLRELMPFEFGAASWLELAAILAEAAEEDVNAFADVEEILEEALKANYEVAVELRNAGLPVEEMKHGAAVAFHAVDPITNAINAGQMPDAAELAGGARDTAAGWLSERGAANKVDSAMLADVVMSRINISERASMVRKYAVQHVRAAARGLPEAERRAAHMAAARTVANVTDPAELEQLAKRNEAHDLVSGVKSIRAGNKDEGMRRFFARLSQQDADDISSQTGVSRDQYTPSAMQTLLDHCQGGGGIGFDEGDKVSCKYFSLNACRKAGGNYFHESGQAPLCQILDSLWIEKCEELQGVFGESTSCFLPVKRSLQEIENLCHQLDTKNYFNFDGHLDLYQKCVVTSITACDLLNNGISNGGGNSSDGKCKVYQGNYPENWRKMSSGLCEAFDGVWGNTADAASSYYCSLPIQGK